MRTADEILEFYNERLKADEPALSLMREVQSVYNLDVVVPLPEMDKVEKPAVANLIAEAIDQISMRAASVMPHVLFPALNPRSQPSRDRADIRRRATLGWMQASKFKRMQRRRFRYLSAYGIAPVHIKPNFKTGMPKWEIRNPLQTFPNPSEINDDDEPLDVIVAYRKPLAWLKANYPDQTRRLFKGTDPSDTDLYTVLEYNDDQETVLVVAGSSESREYAGYEQVGVSGAEVLERVVNLSGMCQIVTPKRITLDRLYGQFNQVIGIWENMAMLTALDLIATKKSVFPDLALIGQNGQAPKLLGEEWKDGLSGEVNEIQDGDIRAVQLQPGFHTGEAIDRQERHMRQSGIASQFGGENNTNIRTGRASEVAMSAQVDFRIQEYQEIAADSGTAEIKRAIAVAKGWFGNKPKSFYVHWKGAKGPVDYVPNTHFETDVCEVVYPMPGADINGMLMGLGNRVGIGSMSLQTMRELDPLIEDAEIERDRVVSERLDTAMLDSLSQMAAGGALPPADLAALKRKVFRENKDLDVAVEEVQAEAQERQAEQVEATDPAAQPGIAIPGAGAEAGVAIPEVAPGLNRLTDMLYAMRQPQSPAGGAPPPMPMGV